MGRAENMSMTAEVKSRMIELADEHQKNDEYLAGRFWNNGKGCSIGCTIHDAKKLGLVDELEYGDHAALAKVLGVPEFVTRIMDTIFEWLPDAERPAFTPLVLRTIRPDRHYATLQDHFSAWCMLDPKYGVSIVASNPDVRCVSKRIGELYAKRARGEAISDADLEVAQLQADAAQLQADAARQQAFAAQLQVFATQLQVGAVSQLADAVLQQSDASRGEFWRACRDKLIDLLAA